MEQEVGHAGSSSCGRPRPFWASISTSIILACAGACSPLVWAHTHEKGGTVSSCVTLSAKSSPLGFHPSRTVSPAGIFQVPEPVIDQENGVTTVSLSLGGNLMPGHVGKGGLPEQTRGQ